MASNVTNSVVRLHTAAHFNVRQQGSLVRRAVLTNTQKTGTNRSRCAHLEVACVSGGAKQNQAAYAKGVKYGVRMIGTGSAVPSNILTNKDMESLVETSAEWIESRTGIKQRHIIGKDQTIADLGAEAAAKALEMANVSAEDVDLIILCTSTPDDIFGSACLVQAKLGAKNAAAYDLTAACSGFVVGLVNATHMIHGGNFKNVLVIGADALSRFVDWRDRGTCILFGDGCGAMLLQGVEGECNVLGFDFKID